MKAPRSLWVGVDESTELRALKEALEAALLRAGFEKDKKAFRPHLTLCRIRSKAASKSIAAMAGPIEVEKKVAFVVDRFVLYKSILSPSGARYEIIREFPFEGKGA
jgi:2'-5' RNA ligase